MTGSIRWVVGGTLLIAMVSTVAAQSPNTQQPPSGYTLHANVREVVTDVTVTDRNGNPIRGLSESAFHIFDNGKPQRVGTFSEHTEQEPNTGLTETPAGVYSNDVLVHPPRVFNIILIDRVTIDLVDQMYLNQELGKFVAKLPPGVPFAVFARGGDHVMMLANFTSDHQRLLTAIHEAIPRLQAPGYRYMTDFSLLLEISELLQQYPGRKNILWFTGGSSAFLRPDPTSVLGYEDMRPVYDLLDSARIALYPIDARGLEVTLSNSSGLQHLLMEDEANATGGHAFFNTNGLALAAEHLAETDASYYTLTYSPQDVKLDNKWHKVKVEVEGNYQLSYRRGYFDDGANLKTPESTGERKRLVQNGEVVPEIRMEPIIFEVRATPADQAPAESQGAIIHSSPTPPGKGEHTYYLHYSVPLDAFPMQTSGAKDQISLGLGVVAINQYGRLVTRIAQQVTLGLAQEHLDSAPAGTKVSLDQQVNLPVGEDFLYIAVWNTKTGRVGTLQIPLAVAKAPKQ
jgi:VWFA-related protein